MAGFVEGIWRSLHYYSDIVRAILSVELVFMVSIFAMMASAMAFYVRGFHQKSN